MKNFVQWLLAFFFSRRETFLVDFLNESSQDDLFLDKSGNTDEPSEDTPSKDCFDTGRYCTSTVDCIYRVGGMGEIGSNPGYTKKNLLSPLPKIPVYVPTCRAPSLLSCHHLLVRQ